MMSATMKATATKSKVVARRPKAESEASKRRRLGAMLDELSVETKALLARATETSVRLTKKFG